MLLCWKCFQGSNEVEQVKETQSLAEQGWTIPSPTQVLLHCQLSSSGVRGGSHSLLDIVRLLAKLIDDDTAAALPLRYAVACSAEVKDLPCY